MIVSDTQLPFCRANELAIQAPEKKWLIQSVWGQSAVGIIGGAPKCCKSWLGLDMAVSVASGTPFLDHFSVQSPGKALVFLAEDAISAVRSRIEAICDHRQIVMDKLELYAITASTLRLDLDCDQKRLTATLAALKPRLLILDPLVRLHRLDENSAAEISKLLGFIREMQRTYDTAIVLVHHASKKHRAQPGQALRGSSDLHAFGDSNAYLARKNDRIVLTLEHRAAKPPDPFEMELVSKKDGSATHLEMVAHNEKNTEMSLKDRILYLLQHSAKPITRTAIREHLRVNNQRLGKTLIDLDKKGLVLHTPTGWIAYNNNTQKQLELF